MTNRDGHSGHSKKECLGVIETATVCVTDADARNELGSYTKEIANDFFQK